MKKILNLLAATAAALLCLPPAGLRAQQFNTNPVELPSSTVWQQMKYNNVAGASLYTGTVNISIPLYDYQDGEMAIPISLGYSANGYQPNIHSGIVGHDWALNAGGAITRTVRGLPDEASNNSRYGFLETFYDTSISSVFELTGFTTAMDSYWIGATTPRIYYSRYGFYNPSILMDTEPDIFYFNFLGYSGKFQLGYDGLIHVYDTNTRSEEFKVEVPRYNLDEIVIITGDGTRYTFGTGNALEDDTSYGTAWKLASISTQSGRSATFSYVTQARQYNSTNRITVPFFFTYAPSSSCYSFSGNVAAESGTGTVSIHQGYGPSRAVCGPYIQASVLDAISLDNGSVIEFFYKNLGQYETGDGWNFQQRPKLDRIVVRDADGNEVRTCAFSYSFPAASASNQIPFLSAVDISGEGTFRMAYDFSAATVFPKQGTFSIDHWGYYNHSGASYSDFYTHTSLDSNLTETITTTCRNPNFSYAKIGMLTVLTYPTGGRTEFEYEANNYSRYVDRAYPSFIPEVKSLAGYPVTTGGVRIKAIKDYLSPDDASPAFRRSYTYTGPDGKSSGILLRKPRYSVQYRRYDANSSLNCYFGSYNDLLPADGTHIEYYTVTESFDEGSRVYEFISSLDCPDGDFYWDHNNSDIKNLSYSVTPSVETILSVMIPPVSMQATRGKLLSCRTYDTQGNEVERKFTDYETYAYAFETLEKVWSFQSMYIAGTIVPTVVGDIRPLSTTTVADGVTDTETLVYDAFRNVRSRTRGGQTSKYFFLQDIDDRASFSDFQDILYWNSFASGNVCARMKELNLVNLPLQTEVYDSDGILHIRRYLYGYRSNNDHSAVYLQSIQERDSSGSSGSWHNLITYDERDIRGRILQTSDANGISTVYVWGYNGLYPVAQIVGATLTQVKAVSGLSGIENAPLSGALSSTQVSALRNISGAEVTTWEYAPLVGLTKETTPDGRSTSYTYNASGKLHQVLDDLGRKTAAYLYSPDNKQQ